MWNNFSRVTVITVAAATATNKTSVKPANTAVKRPVALVERV
jgi:hypothetical protein